MKAENFNELIASMKEGGEILRGEREASRKFTISSKEDVQYVRHSFSASQSEFARFMGVSVGTLRNWEQGRRQPTGAARVLLTIAMKQPEIFRMALAEHCPEFV